jgi:ferredoxin
MPTINPEERKRSFVQFELGYEEPDALREAWRCLSCTAGAQVDDDKCAACLTCLRVCPFGVPAVDETAVMQSEMCQACGLCATECPAIAISIKRFSVGDIAGRITELMQGSGQQVTRLEICCAQDAETRAELVPRITPVNGDVVGRVPVNCAALADEVDMMKPFELGAETVVVRMCAPCRYKGADDRLAKRVARTKRILDECGIGGERLTLAGPPEDEEQKA